MSEFEVFIRNADSKYGDGIMVSKYGDNYSLIAARESKNGGTVYKDWAFPQDRDKQPKAKAIPMGVRLGNRNHAIDTLRRALQVLTETIPQNPAAGPVPRGPVGPVADESDLPF